MITKSLLKLYEQQLALPPLPPEIWASQEVRDREHQLESALATAVLEAAQLTPGSHRARALLLDIYQTMPEKLPWLLSALLMNLSSKDESMLRETYGILELTRRQSPAALCFSPSGRNSEM